MQQFPPTEDVKPHGPIDLTDQSSMFLVLEELGITYMQREWLAANAPESPDLKAAEEQHEEFFDDLCGILEGKAGEDRVVPNGWAGAKAVAHLRAACPDVVERALERLGSSQKAADAADADVFRAVLTAFELSLSRLTARQLAMKSEGCDMSPSEYIQLMIGWSGVLSGAADALKLEDKDLPFL